MDQTLVTGQRDATTVPSQALFLLNSAFVRKQSLALADRVLADNKTSIAEKIQQAYRLTLGRAANEKEIARAEKFLAEFESSYRESQLAEPSIEKPVPKKKSEPKKSDVIPANPDELDQTGETITEESVRPKTPKSAAWMNFIQAIHASAEVRFVR